MADVTGHENSLSSCLATMIRRRRRRRNELERKGGRNEGGSIGFRPLFFHRPVKYPLSFSAACPSTDPGSEQPTPITPYCTHNDRV